MEAPELTSIRTPALDAVKGGLVADLTTIVGKLIAASKGDTSTGATWAMDREAASISGLIETINIQARSESGDLKPPETFESRVLNTLFSVRTLNTMNKAILDDLTIALEADSDNNRLCVADSKDAVLTFAIEPDVETLFRLRKVMEQRFGVPAEREVKTCYDKNLLGGVKIVIGSLEIDGTVQTMLVNAIGDVREEEEKEAEQRGR